MANPLLTLGFAAVAFRILAKLAIRGVIRGDVPGGYDPDSPNVFDEEQFIVVRTNAEHDATSEGFNRLVDDGMASSYIELWGLERANTQDIWDRIKTQFKDFEGVVGIARFEDDLEPEVVEPSIDAMDRLIDNVYGDEEFWAKVESSLFAVINIVKVATPGILTTLYIFKNSVEQAKWQPVLERMLTDGAAAYAAEKPYPPLDEIFRFELIFTSLLNQDMESEIVATLAAATPTGLRMVGGSSSPGAAAAQAAARRALASFTKR